MTEPEFLHDDGTVRKEHYGRGRQPWDDIVEQGWGPAFAAGNALKYVRRHGAKNGADDLEKGRWYWRRLVELTHSSLPGEASYARGVKYTLTLMLTAEELRLLTAD